MKAGTRRIARFMNSTIELPETHASASTADTTDVAIVMLHAYSLSYLGQNEPMHRNFKLCRKGESQ